MCLGRCARRAFLFGSRIFFRRLFVGLVIVVTGDRSTFYDNINWAIALVEFNAQLDAVKAFVSDNGLSYIIGGFVAFIVALNVAGFSQPHFDDFTASITCDRNNDGFSFVPYTGIPPIWLLI